MATDYRFSVYTFDFLTIGFNDTHVALRRTCLLLPHFCDPLRIYLYDKSILCSGWYCDDSGLEVPTERCAAGYYCNGGATTATPDSNSSTGYQGDTCVDRSNGASNDLCPPGHYCPEGAMMANTNYRWG